MFYLVIFSGSIIIKNATHLQVDNVNINYSDSFLETSAANYIKIAKEICAYCCSFFYLVNGYLTGI